MPNPTPPDQPTPAGVPASEDPVPDATEAPLAAPIVAAPIAAAPAGAGGPPHRGGRAPRAGAIAIIVLASVLGVGGIVGGTGLLSGAAAGPSGVPAAPSSSEAPVSASPAPATVGPATPAASAPASGSPGATGTPSTSPPSVASPPPSTAPTPTPSSGIPAAKLQRRLVALAAKHHLPGVSVAILWDDGRQWLGAAGYRDVAARDPMTTGTAFALASISKTMTAGVVLQLVGEGKLSLDTRVARLLPEFLLDRRITVRMLLDHTSGLPDYFLNPKIDKRLQAAPDVAWDAGQAWSFVPPKRPRPGTTWAYSNSNYLLLGVLVQRVTGNPLADEIRSRILDPLGLDSTWYQGAESPRAKGTRSYRTVVAGGHWRFVPVARRSDVMPFRSVVTAAGGAGSIAATAADAARWMQAYAGGRVVGPGLQREMLADVALTAKLKARIPYGLGIQALPLAGHPALGHSGRFLGFRNVVRYLPDAGITIAVLTNQGTTDPAKVAEALLKSVLPKPVRQAPSSAPSSARPSPAHGGASAGPSTAPAAAATASTAP